MSNLIVTENIINQLPENLKPFAYARIGTQFKDLNTNDQKRLCLNIITKGYFDSGDKGATSPDVLTVQSQALMLELKGKFGCLTGDEIGNAFNLGIRGDSGAWFGMCAKSYHQFLKHYIEKPERFKAQEQYLAIIDGSQLKRVDKPVTQMFKESTQSLLNYFEDYKKDGYFSLEGAGAWVYYDALVIRVGVWEVCENGEGLKTLYTDLELRKKFYADAVKEYKSRLSSDKSKRVITGNQYQTLLDNLSGGKNRTVINLAKKHSLKYYFDVLISEGKELDV